MEASMNVSKSLRLHNSISLYARNDDTAEHSSVQYASVMPKLQFVFPEKSDIKDSLDGLTNRTWRTYSATPLYNLLSGEPHLKRYAGKLCSSLRLSENSCYVDYSVNFSVRLDLMASRPNHQAIQIVVTGRRADEASSDSAANRKRRKVVKTLYDGILLSWCNTHSMSFKGCISLPLILCSGFVSIIDSVHAALKGLFHTSITPLMLGQPDLMWLIVISVAAVTSKEMGDEMRLQYHIPGTHKSSVVHYNMDQYATKTLWNSIHHIYETERFEYEEVVTFNIAIEEHFKKVFSIDLSYAHIRGFELKQLIKMSSNGQVNTSSKLLLSAVLKYLTSRMDIENRIQGLNKSLLDATVAYRVRRE